VEIFESRRRLGGRAGSFLEPHSGAWIDHCQHVWMGCCVNLADFCRRTGVAECFARHRRLHFIAPDGTRHDFSATSWLPVPLHLAPALFRLSYLSLAERWRIVRALRRLAAEETPVGGSETIGPWLRRHGQSQRAIERFWSVVLVSALGETIDRASTAAAGKVCRDGFLASRHACELLIPQVPLSEIYDRRMADWFSEHGVAVHLGARVHKIEGSVCRAEALVLADGAPRAFDYILAAVPWRNVRALFPDPMLQALPDLSGIGRIQPAPITAVHLWFDRPIAAIPHAVLIGRLGQWLFNKNGSVAAAANSPEHYYQVVISASHGLRGRDPKEVAEQVCGELRAIWPAAQKARLIRWRVVSEPEAVFSMQPGLDSLRPNQRTPIPNLLLAGDWTATGWPATMEGAVRSGYLAVECLLAALGRPQPVLIPDPPPAVLARRMLRGG
jgi:squalene-associated FAD-dependent desaturase